MQTKHTVQCSHGNAKNIRVNSTDFYKSAKILFQFFFIWIWMKEPLCMSRHKYQFSAFNISSRNAVKKRRLQQLHSCLTFFSARCSIDFWQRSKIYPPRFSHITIYGNAGLKCLLMKLHKFFQSLCCNLLFLALFYDAVKFLTFPPHNLWSTNKLNYTSFGTKLHFFWNYKPNLHCLWSHSKSS